MPRAVELLYILTLRDIQSRYKQSIVGIGWAVLQPLALMFVFDLVFSRLLHTDSEGFPYPIFVYSCLLPWTFFANSLSKATAAIESNGSIIKKIHLDNTLFVTSSVLSALVDFAAAALVFIGMMFYYHVSISPWILMIIPIIAIQIILVVGIGFFLSAINAYYRDVKYALPLIIQVWMYASPIVYSISVVPDRLAAWYQLNPTVGLMVAYRNILVKGIAPDWSLLLTTLVISVIVFILGLLVFKRMEGKFADVI